MVKNQGVKRGALAVALMVLTVVAMASPAGAFSNSSSINTGGTSFKTNATSCNVYWSACSWNTGISASKSKRMTHKTQVKANGFKLKIELSTSSAGVSITGNNTSMVSASRTITGKSNKMSGVAKPSKFSVSVSAHSRLTSGSLVLNSGWTTW